MTAVERIDQLIPVLAGHDAIGGHALQMRDQLRTAGFRSDIWAEHVDARLQAEARPFEACPMTAPGRVVLYQLSTQSGIAAWAAAAGGAGQEVWADYHNITPAAYFARWEPAAAESMVAARDEFAGLATLVGRAMADSRYNEDELVAAGYPATATVPLLVDLERYHDDPDPTAVDRLRRRRESSGASWLFVGRIAPNKCQHDVIGAFAVYRRLFDPGARLTLVGGATSPRYRHALDRLVRQLDVGGSVELLDNVPAPVLLAHFATADVFVCLSEHEGFCVPVLEAFELGVPVVAYRAAALPETVGPAGVLLDSKDPLDVATAVRDLLGDPARTQALVAAGRARATDFALPATSARMLDVVHRWLAEGAAPSPVSPAAP